MFDEYERNEAKFFCNRLKQHIIKRAEQGEFSLDGKSYTIKGIAYRSYDTDVGEVWHFSNGLKSGSRIFDYTAGTLRRCEKGKSNIEEMLHVNRCVTEQKSRKTPFRAGTDWAWIQTFELSYRGERFLNFAKALLKEDGILLSHQWIIDTRHKNTLGNPISSERQQSDSNKIEICKHWLDDVSVYLVFYFRFEY